MEKISLKNVLEGWAEAQQQEDDICFSVEQALKRAEKLERAKQKSLKPQHNPRTRLNEAFKACLATEVNDKFTKNVFDNIERL